MRHEYENTLKSFAAAGGKKGKFFSLPELARQYPQVRRLPVSLRIVLESVLRNCDGNKVTREHVEQLANWKPQAERVDEIPFVVSRVVLQDFTGVPLLADLAAMRSTAARLGKKPKSIEPLVPVDLVVDHSIMVDYFGTKKALDLNMKLEFQRNKERYQFMKWGMQAFDTFGVVPPGFGIVHQVNLEYLARGVHKTKDGVHYPDTLVGTDSHTTMINGIGVVGWGVGGIEAEAAMLGQPVYFLTPDVVGFELSGQLREGVTATDLVLSVTEILRREKVVGKFVEFFGEGTRTLALPDRATIGNMAPEYGATMGFFPVDEKTIDYFRGTGRSKAEIEAFEGYFRAQELFGVPAAGEIDYSHVVRLDLGTVAPSLAGPKRPQDRIELGNVSSKFDELFSAPAAHNGFNQPIERLGRSFPVGGGGEGEVAPETPAHPPGAQRSLAEMEANKPKLEAAHSEAPVDAPTPPKRLSIANGDVLIAAITSCTNTSNPSVMLAAGLLAKKAVKAGLTVQPHIKTSLAPGSRVVTEYLTEAGLLPYLEKLGFALAGYGCTTCIGNAGDLTPELNEAITSNDLVCAAVLSGNRNFEARIHPNIKANFLASPPLVVAYAIAGTVRRDLMTEPVGQGKNGRDIYLGDIWPTSEEIHALMKYAMNGKAFRENYEKVRSEPGKLWEKIHGVTGATYTWPESTYIAEPPFFDDFRLQLDAPAAGAAGAAGAEGSNPYVVHGARVMALFGDSITTDHISPAGSIKESSPAGQWLLAHGVQKADFNSYGSRRGNHEVMMRGTFANVRIKNLMIPAQADGSREEGGLTLYRDGTGQVTRMWEAIETYMERKQPLIIIAGADYGQGSSRDWAAKGVRLAGVEAIVAEGFERIHRTNLVGMGVLPLEFKPGTDRKTLGIDGSETYDVIGARTPRADLTLVIHRKNGERVEVPVTCRLDTAEEVSIYEAGGVLQRFAQDFLEESAVAV